jgi:glycosyltransferase involved in cell wall biosynthesis
MIIAGDGPERQCLEQVALKHEVSEKVVFLGSVLDVRPALSAMDLFVLPSRAVETFSNAALEAMSMGLPVVLSDIGGAREMVPDGKNGAIFAPGDVDGLTEKIEKLIRSGVLDEMGAASRSLVEERFSLESMVARYRDLIQRC